MLNYGTNDGPFVSSTKTVYTINIHTTTLLALLSADSNNHHLVRDYKTLSLSQNAWKQATSYILSRPMSFKDFLAEAKETTMYWAMHRDSAKLQEYLNATIPQTQPCEFSLWISPLGHTEQVHYDSYSNTVYQLSGSKTWRLWPPHAAITPCSLTSPNPNFSSLDVHDIIIKDEVTITVHAGDVLHIPPGWWHSVTGVACGVDSLVVSANVFSPPPLSSRVSWRLIRLKIAEATDEMMERYRVMTGAEIPVIDATNL